MNERGGRCSILTRKWSRASYNVTDRGIVSQLWVSRLRADHQAFIEPKDQNSGVKLGKGTGRAGVKHRTVYGHLPPGGGGTAFCEPNVIRNLPASISRRLTDISSNKDVFADAKPLYDKALWESGFSAETEYLERRKEQGRANRRTRSRKVIWFNPPFSQNVATNIGRKFRSLVLKHFPEASKLNKIFNPNTLKVSYSCMPNMAAVIRQHNSTIINSQPSAPDNAGSASKCNCRVKANCPMKGECLVQSVVYRATVRSQDTEKDYTGLTVSTFKQRFNSHQHSMRPRKYRHSTALSNYVWSLKDQDIAFDIKWTVLRKAAAYRNTTRRCSLCIAEKLEIMKADKDRSLNRRS